MSDQSIADSAIYQETVKLAEKYKGQRDELLEAAKNMRDVKGRHHTEIATNALFLIVEMVEQSL